MRRRPSAAIVTPEACLRHDAVAVEHFLQLAPGMRPAMGHADGVAALAGGVHQAVVARISVELEDPVEAAQERLGVLPAAAGRIEEHDPGGIRTAPASIIADQGPEVAGRRVEDAPPARCPAAPGIEHRRRGLVHEELGGRLQVFGQPIDDGPQVERGDTVRGSARSSLQTVHWTV